MHIIGQSYELFEAMAVIVGAMVMMAGCLIGAALVSIFMCKLSADMWSSFK